MQKGINDARTLVRNSRTEEARARAQRQLDTLESEKAELIANPAARPSALNVALAANEAAHIETQDAIVHAMDRRRMGHVPDGADLLAQLNANLHDSQQLENERRTLRARIEAQRRDELSRAVAGPGMSSASLLAQAAFFRRAAAVAAAKELQDARANGLPVCDYCTRVDHITGDCPKAIAWLHEQAARDSKSEAASVTPPLPKRPRTTQHTANKAKALMATPSLRSFAVPASSSSAPDVPASSSLAPDIPAADVKTIKDDPVKTIKKGPAMHRCWKCCMSFSTPELLEKHQREYCARPVKIDPSERTAPDSDAD